MDTDRAKRSYSPALKAIIVIAGIFGQVVSLRRGGFASGAYFLYYTNISNILVTLLSVILLVLDLSARKRGEPLILPRWLLTVRFALTAGILLTFVGFSLLLIPTVPLDYLASPANLLVHNLVPLLACLDFILFKHAKKDKQPLLPGLALPFIYFALILALTFFGVRFNGQIVPYYFLDYLANGWFTAGDGTLGVFWWLLLLGALSMLLSFVLRGLQRLSARKAEVLK